MKVRFLGGPLAGRVLSTSPEPWPGGWLTADGVHWALYRPVHRDPVSGIVLAEVQETGRPTPGRGPIDG
ncbi:hypothetical protein OG828_36960 [Streptomyces sp. NBC_00457]|uniref:hypothetical protein n=1 Tax=Streptomyces sp. NBC_00457 TaxID=2975748 RepID=UPI002E217F87